MFNKPQAACASAICLPISRTPRRSVEIGHSSGGRRRENPVEVDETVEAEPERRKALEDENHLVITKKLQNQSVENPKK